VRKIGLQVILVLSLLVVSLSFLTAKVNGEVRFSDLNENEVYYNSVMELVNEGVISGYSDGTFKPDNNIFICEALTIIERVFGNPENLPEWSKWKELTETGYIYQTDWDLEYRLFFNNYFGGVTSELAGHFILASNNIELLDSEAFGYSNEFSNYSNLLLRGYKLEKGHHEFLTRAEFCDLVVWARYNIHNVPEYSVDFPIRYSFVGYEDLNNRKVFETYVLGAFLKAPDWLINYYSNRNGRIKIVEESKWDMVNHAESAATYHHRNNAPLISVRNVSYDIVMHELGHFVYFSGCYNVPNKIFREESDELVNILLNDYCKTNEIEYFAEAFSACFTHPVLMQKKCPETYTFIKDICDILEEKYK
jgi:hypothetical protein